MNQLSSQDIELLKRASRKRVKPGLPELKPANICKFVESTVLAQYTVSKYTTVDQLAASLAVRNLISACISYITVFQPPEKHKWEYVHSMLASGVDETYQTPAGTSLDAVFQGLKQDYPDCLALALYQSAAEGKNGHFAETLSKALLMVTDYIFFT